MDKELTKNLEEFRNTITKEGEHIVFSRFPKKILELQQLIQTTSNPDSPFHISQAEAFFTDATIYPPLSDVLTNGASQKKRKLDADSDKLSQTHAQTELQGAMSSNRIYANRHMSNNVHGITKRECGELASMIDQVKLWVTLTMPKIEDGDNFGVQIQEEVLGELHRAQESAYNLRDAARQDHLARAKICSKLLKYPNLEDYTLALKEHDERQLYIARQHLIDIRNLYAVLTDLIHKNISKIRSPKANNSVGLY